MNHSNVEGNYDIIDEFLDCNIKSYLLKLQAEVVRFKAEMYINERKMKQHSDEIDNIGDDIGKMEYDLREIKDIINNVKEKY